MARSHRMGIRGLLIAGFLVVAPLVAVFQGPLQDRFDTLFKRDKPKSTTVASADASGKPAGKAGGFRPVIRGDDNPPGSDTAENPLRFPDELPEPQSGGIAERRVRADDPRQKSAVKNAADVDASPADDGAVAQRRPVRKYDEVQTRFQNGDGIAESPRRRPSRSDLDDPADEGRSAADSKPARGKSVAKGRDDRHDMTVAEDDVMEKAGGGRKEAISDPLARPYAKLRDMGATASRLETWGADGDRYRFQCRVATDADPSEARHFEATDEQPLRAIEKVVQQVEAWQGQRR